MRLVSNNKRVKLFSVQSHSGINVPHSLSSIKSDSPLIHKRFHIKTIDSVYRVKTQNLCLVLDSVSMTTVLGATDLNAEQKTCSMLN